MQQTVPCVYWLRHQLRHLDPDLLQALLQSSVQAFKQEIPSLGETVAFDVKHIYAWMREKSLSPH